MNGQGNDLDFRMESDTNASHFVSDAGAFSGVGAFGFGAVPFAGRAFVSIDMPALSESTTSYFGRVYVPNTNALTVNAANTAAATLVLDEPNITIGGGGSVADAYTLILNGAPTAGTRNGALWVASGASRLDGLLQFSTDNFIAREGAGNLKFANASLTYDNEMTFGAATARLANIHSVLGSFGVTTNRANEFYVGSNGDLYFTLDTAVSSAQAPILFMTKARGTQASRTIVVADDQIGGWDMRGYDGSAFRQAASIAAYSDGTPGASDMPGRLVFATTPDGAAAVVERLRISNDGTVVFNETGTDSDFRIESDTTANHFVSNAGLYTGVGAFGFGADPSIHLTNDVDPYIYISRPAMTAEANDSASVVTINTAAAITIPVGTAPLVSTLDLTAPGITNNGTITTTATLYISNAASAGASNYALFVDSGLSRFDGDIQIGTTPATAGAIRIPTDTYLYARNQANDNNIPMIGSPSGNITGLFSIAGSSIEANANDLDVDFKIRSDTNTSHFVSDAGAFSGVGAFGFGGLSATDTFVFINNPAITYASTNPFSKQWIYNSAAITLNTSTSAAVSSLRVSEPNITIGTGAVSDAYSFIIDSAPTEGTRNGALWVASGTARFDQDAVFNESGGDYDFRIESDTNANTFGVNAGAFDGVGAINFGFDQSTAGYIFVRPPTMTTTADTNFAVINISPSNTFTVPTGTTNAFSTLSLEAVTQTLTGTVSDNYTLRIGGAPTGGTRNGAIWVDSGDVRFDGQLAIGMTAASVALDVTGDIEYTGTITDVSDERLKENITDYSGGLAVINSLWVKSYNMISDPGVPETGFIAQNVQEFFPQAVHTVDPEHGYLGVSYVSMIPVLTKAIQELDLKIEGIEERVAALEANGTGGGTGLTAMASSFFETILTNVENGVGYMTALVVNTLTVGSAEEPTGLTMYDPTGSAYCVKLDVGGAVISTSGVCTTEETPPSGGGGDGGETPPLEEGGEPSSDTTAPVITLTGEATINLNVGDAYTESGATATDDVDGEVAVVISGSVDTNVAGTYTITYNASDGASNPAVEVTRTVNVVTP